MSPINSLEANLVDFFNKQIDRLDEKQGAQYDRIDKKLDKLMELASDVATLHERSVRNANDIIELKLNTTATKERVDKQFDILHEDVKKISTKISKTETDIKSEVNKIDSVVKKYVYIGIGMGITASVFVSMVEWAGYEFVKGWKEEFLQVKTKIENIQEAVRVERDKNERQELLLEGINKNITSAFQHQYSNITKQPPAISKMVPRAPDSEAPDVSPIVPPLKKKSVMP